MVKAGIQRTPKPASSELDSPGTIFRCIRKTEFTKYNIESESYFRLFTLFKPCFPKDCHYFRLLPALLGAHC